MLQGVALRSLSNDIIAATDAQISFTDASQAAAIGTASGLSPDQLKRLGTAAKDASIILGRDVTDSFNRLVRGVTKAEPELLDELGIILRLDDATQKYADSLNLNQKDLTAFQRSQAVANDVLEQAEQKYSRIIAVVNPGVNTFNKLGKSFDNIINKIKEFAAILLGPFAEAITQFPALGVALLGIFGKGVLTAALPGLRDIGENAQKSAQKAQESFDAAKASLKAYTTETRVANKAAAASRAQALGDPGFKTTKPGSGFDLLKQGRGSELSSHQIVGMQRAIANNKDLSKKMKKDWQAALQEMLLATKTSTRGIEQEFKKTTGKISLFFKAAEVQVKGAFASMKAAAASFAAFAATALSIISWVSLGITLGVTVYQFFKAKKAADENSHALDYAAEKVAALNDEFKDFNKIQSIITEDGGASLKYFTALGERIGSVSLNTLQPLFDEAFDPDKFSKWVEAQEIALKRATIVADEYETNYDKIWNASKSFFSWFADPYQVVPTMDKLEELNERVNETTISFGDFLNTNDDQRLKDLGKYFTDQAAALTTVNQNFGGQGSSAILSYLNILKQLTDSTDLSAEAFQALFNQLKEGQVEVSRVTQLFKDYERGLQDVNNQANQLRTGFLNVTKEEAAADALRTQIRLTQELNEEMQGSVTGPLAGLTSDQIKAYNQNLRDLDFAVALDNLEKNKLSREKDLAILTEKSLLGRTKRQADLINLELKSKELENNRLYIKEQIAIIENERVANGGILNNQEQTNLNNLLKEKELNEEKERSLERQLSLTAQIFDAANQSLESNLQKGIADMIKGTEGSFKDMLLNLGKAVLETVADTLAGQITDVIMGTDPITKGLQMGQAAGDVIKTAIIEGAEVAGNVLSGTTGTSTIEGAAGAALSSEKGPGFFSRLGSYVFGDKKKQITGSEVVDDQGLTARNMDGMVEGATRRAGGIFGPFLSGLQDLFSADAPFVERLGGVFGGVLQGFGNIFKGLGGLFGGQNLGGLGGGLLSILGLANGGVMKGGFRAYASGGIATSPTMGLIGEGRYNEAVVPLPNGKSIPVQMNGAGQNNVTVNVSIDNQGNASTNTQQDSAQAGNLGQAIARAVQMELQNQKRSGGILSPYGAA